MTLGMTGVVWLPRGATVNSTSLTTGTGPLPIGAAGPGWAAVAAAFADADLTLTRVAAELGLGWEGTTGGSAITSLGPFIAWTQSVVGEATAAAQKAAVGSAAYATALIAMPSLPEIAAVQAAKATAYTAGGAVNGAAAAAEAAEKALDLRAAAAMEAYEAATVFAAVPDRFTAPPSLTADAPASIGVQELAAVASRMGRTEHVQFSDPVQSVVDGAHSVASRVGEALGNGDVLRSVGGEAGRVAAEVAASGGSGVAGSAAPQVASLFGQGHASTVATSTYTPGTGLGAASAPAAVHSATITGSGTIAGPSGLGAIPTAGGLAAAGGTAAGISSIGATAGGTATGTATGPVRGDLRVSGDPIGGPAAPAHGIGSAAARAADGGSDDDRGEQTRTDFRPTVEHFADGRTVVPSVLGADPEPGR
ncbi:PPE domain-containing protein [Rhodococcus sp. NPDC003382]